MRKVEKVLCKVLLKWDTRLNGELESKAFHVVSLKPWQHNGTSTQSQPTPKDVCRWILPGVPILRRQYQPPNYTRSLREALPKNPPSNPPLKSSRKEESAASQFSAESQNLHVQTQAQSWSPANEISARADSQKYLKTRNNQRDRIADEYHMKSFRFKFTIQPCIPL